jgi:hypothetical protein
MLFYLYSLTYLVLSFLYVLRWRAVFFFFFFLHLAFFTPLFSLP